MTHMPGEHLPGRPLPGGHRMSHAERVAHGGVPLPSTDPTLGNATNPYIAQEVHESVNSLREYMMSLGDFTNELRGIVQQIVALPNEIRQGDTVGGRHVGGVGTMNQSVPPSQARKAEAAAQVSEGAAPEEQARRMTFSEGREVMRNMSMGSATQKAAGFMASALSQREHPWARAPQMVNGSMAYVQKDSETGEILRSVPFNASNPESEAAAAAVRDKGIARQAHLTSAVGALGRYAGGEGVAGALGGTAARLAGPIGIAVGAVAKGFDYYNQQLAAGGEFRQIYGEDAGRFAITQRTGRQMAGLEGFFTGTGRERAMQAYTAAAGMGLTGDRLEAATDFDREMFMKHGMSTDESMRFVQMNANNSAVSLKELSDQIDQVGRSAVEAGRNSDQAIQSFAQISETLQGTLSAAPGVTDVAAAIQTTANRMPRNLAAGTAASLTQAVTSPDNIMLQAVMSGKPVGATMNEVSLNPQAALGLAVGGIDKAVEAICGLMGKTPDQLRQEISDNYGGRGPKDLSPDEKGQVLAPYSDQVNPPVMMEIYRQFAGMDIAFGDVIFRFFNDLDQLGGAESLRGGGGLFGQFNRVKAGVAAATGGQMSADSYTNKTTLQQDLYGKPVIAGRGYAASPMPTQDTDLFNQYNTFASGHGRNTALEGLMQGGEDIAQKAGVDALEDVTFNTSRGPRSLTEIMSSKRLMAEFGKGEISTVEGAKGETAFDITKYTGLVDPDSPMSSKENKGQTASVNGVTISLTNYAAKLLKLTGPSGSQRGGTPAVATTSVDNWYSPGHY